MYITTWKLNTFSIYKSVNLISNISIPNALSSGDEIDNDLNRGADEGSDSDSFEKEMEMELNKEFSKYSQQLFDGKKQNAGLVCFFVHGKPVPYFVMIVII